MDLVAVVLFFLLPERQVLLEELNDALGVTEVVLLEFIDLVESFLEGTVGKLAGSLVVLHDFVVEHREVKGKTELDGVAGWQGDLVGFVVGLKSILLDLLELGTLGILSDVAVVVADHLDEEGLGLTVAVLGEDLVVNHINNLLAVAGKFLLDFGLVASEGIRELGVLGVLLDSGDGAASSALGADRVLEGNGQQVALIGGNFGTLDIKDLGEEVNHIFEALSLLSDAGKENLLFNAGHLSKVS